MIIRPQSSPARSSLARVQSRSALAGLSLSPPGRHCTGLSLGPVRRSFIENQLFSRGHFHHSKSVSYRRKLSSAHPTDFAAVTVTVQVLPMGLAMTPCAAPGGRGRSRGCGSVTVTVSDSPSLARRVYHALSHCSLPVRLQWSRYTSRRVPGAVELLNLNIRVGNWLGVVTQWLGKVGPWPASGPAKLR
jgi:hypothetical protein